MRELYDNPFTYNPMKLSLKIFAFLTLSHIPFMIWGHNEEEPLKSSTTTNQITNSLADHIPLLEKPTSTSGLSVSTKPLQGPLKIGEKAEVLLHLNKKDGSPLLLDDLKEAHTQKIHLLTIDSSLIDYHHQHPIPTKKPGEYQFNFTPQKPGAYRIWVDIVPTATDKEEYLVADLPAETKGEPITDREPSTSTQLEDLTFTLSFDKTPLKVGEAALAKLKITKGKNAVFTQLEPIMGAYAHIVGFSEDHQTIAHIHPIGPEPTKESDRGIGEIIFHLVPKKPGLLRLFAQIRVKGEDKFARFTLFVPVESD